MSTENLSPIVIVPSSDLQALEGLPPSHLVLYMALRNVLGGHGAWIPMRRLESRTRMSGRTVQRALRCLEELKLIRVERGEIGINANWYTLTTPVGRSGSR